MSVQVKEERDEREKRKRIGYVYKYKRSSRVVWCCGVWCGGGGVVCGRGLERADSCLGLGVCGAGVSGGKRVKLPHPRSYKGARRGGGSS